MKTVTKIIEIYEFSELNVDARMKAINDYINFLLEVTDYTDTSENMKRSYNKAEHMRTPWFLGSYIYEYCYAEIMEGLGEYEFLSDGDIHSEN